MYRTSIDSCITSVPDDVIPRKTDERIINKSMRILLYLIHTYITFYCNIWRDFQKERNQTNEKSRDKKFIRFENVRVFITSIRVYICRHSSERYGIMRAFVWW